MNLIQELFAASPFLLVVAILSALVAAYVVGEALIELWRSHRYRHPIVTHPMKTLNPITPAVERILHSLRSEPDAWDRGGDEHIRVLTHHRSGVRVVVSSSGVTALTMAHDIGEMKRMPTNHREAELLMSAARSQVFDTPEEIKARAIRNRKAREDHATILSRPHNLPASE